MKRRIAFGAIALTVLAILVALSLMFPTEVQSTTAVDSKQEEPKKTCRTVETEVEKLFRLGEEDELVSLGWEISQGDWDFILTVEGESKWNPEAIGDHGNSKGLCQWHQRWQKAVRNDPNFNDARWQVQKCWEFFQGYREAGILHKRLFAYNYRQDKKDRFELKTIVLSKEVCE